MKHYLMLSLSSLVLGAALIACSNTEQAASSVPQTFETLSYPGDIAPELADRFSALAITCVHQEFPNKVSRTTDTAEEIGRPKDLFPVFYGCFDWHSSVHGHWLLVRLLRVGPKDAAWREAAKAKLNQSFT